ncbi:MAG: hypothetical protein ACFHX7_07885 [Pseudomonadota bacterium]
MRIVDSRDPSEARGSLKWLRVAVNQHTAMLNEAIMETCSLEPTNHIEWVSPLESDEFAEYRDQAFLDLLGIRLDERPLANFWPKRGPQWDGLARTSKGEILLVEAKANIPEVSSPGTAAGTASRALISASMEEAKAYLGVPAQTTWLSKYYQFANRMAHLYLLHALNGINARLVFIYFTNASDVNGPGTQPEWEPALKLAKQTLGLDKPHPLSDRVHDVFIDVSTFK